MSETSLSRYFLVESTRYNAVGSFEARVASWKEFSSLFFPAISDFASRISTVSTVVHHRTPSKYLFTVSLKQYLARCKRDVFKEKKKRNGMKGNENWEEKKRVETGALKRIREIIFHLLPPPPSLFSFFTNRVEKLGGKRSCVLSTGESLFELCLCVCVCVSVYVETYLISGRHTQGRLAT